MTRTSTINIRRTRRGTTIRATGGAAQALCDAITGAAAAAETAVEALVALAPARQYKFLIRAEVVKGGYIAYTLVSPSDDTAEVAVGVHNFVGFDEHSDRGAVLKLLAHATPPLRAVRWREAHYSNAGRTIDYTLIAEKA